MAANATSQGSTFGAALTWVQGEYGYLIREFESSPLLPVSTPGAQFLSNNGDRLGLVIVNIGLNPVTVGVDPTQIMNGQGILLSASGGSLSINVRQDLTLPTRAWFGFVIAAPTNLYVLEIIGWKKLPPGSVAGY